MEVIGIILTVAILQSVLFYFLRNSRTFLAQCLISLTIVILYLTLVPKLYVYFKSFEGCALPGLGIHMMFWIMGLIATLLVFLLFLLMRNRKHTENIISN